MKHTHGEEAIVIAMLACLSLHGPHNECHWAFDSA